MSIIQIDWVWWLWNRLSQGMSYWQLCLHTCLINDFVSGHVLLTTLSRGMSLWQPCFEACLFDNFVSRHVSLTTLFPGMSHWRFCLRACLIDNFNSFVTTHFLLAVNQQTIVKRYNLFLCFSVVCWNRREFKSAFQVSNNVNWTKAFRGFLLYSFRTVELLKICQVLQTGNVIEIVTYGVSHRSMYMLSQGLQRNH